MLKWIKYNPDMAVLEVQFNGGKWVRYDSVPAWRVRSLLKTSSKEMYFQRHFNRYDGLQAGSDANERVMYTETPPVIEQSIDTISRCVPHGALEYIRKILHQAPSLISVVRQRKTLRGSCRPELNKEHAKITVNEGMNLFQTLLTTLHELAHAEVAWRNVAEYKPHGLEWKGCYGTILLGAVHEHIFPEELVPHIVRVAADPPYSTTLDEGLKVALKRFDTVPHAKNPGIGRAARYVRTQQKKLLASLTEDEIENSIKSILGEARRLSGRGRTKLEYEIYGTAMTESEKLAARNDILRLSLCDAIDALPRTDLHMLSNLAAITRPSGSVCVFMQEFVESHRKLLPAN
jgi:hypothetical protein